MPPPPATSMPPATVAVPRGALARAVRAANSLDAALERRLFAFDAAAAASAGATDCESSILKADATLPNDAPPHPPLLVPAVPVVVAGAVVGAIAWPAVLARLRQHPDVFVVNPDGVQFRDDLLPTTATRSAALDAVLRAWRGLDAFACLRGWREERYSVWAPAATAVGSLPDSDEGEVEVVLEIERSASGLFGMRHYGCHVNGYVVDAASGRLSMWIAKRSPTKQTYPGMLDNLAAGGMPHGSDPLATAARECFEEAGVVVQQLLQQPHLESSSSPSLLSSQPPELLPRLTPVSVVSFMLLSPTRGLIPDTEFVYDLRLPAEFVPACTDGEVAGFSLMGLDEVVAHLAAGAFMPESGLVVVDFLLRHGLVDPSSEPDYARVAQGLRRPLPFPAARFGTTAAAAAEEVPRSN
ncbi:hypothetical protein HK405_000389 [Cladochytrium tenue]|nr:hypothetical protein HK405_000389 [Cladochytrium tenue]